MKRTPLHRRAPLRQIGRRKQTKAARRAEVIAFVLARDGHCRFWAHYDGTPGFVVNRPPVVHSWPLDVHEIIPRSVWPDGDLDVANCVLLCRGHHDWVTDHPTEAAQLGLHGFSWQR